MIHFFSRLDSIEIGCSLEVIVFTVGHHGEVQIGREQFIVDLVIDGINEFFAEHYNHPFKHTDFVYSYYLRVVLSGSDFKGKNASSIGISKFTNCS
jgi:hypothetical protein